MEFRCFFFGPFELIPGRQVLLRNGAPVRCLNAICTLHDKVSLHFRRMAQALVNKSGRFLHVSIDVVNLNRHMVVTDGKVNEERCV